MNIKVEKKKYIAPRMEVLNFTQEACLLNASDYVSICGEGVDHEDVGGYDDEFQ